jgi:hypothetical protein
MLLRNPGLVDREQACMEVVKFVRWYVRQANTGRKCQAESPVLVNRETAPVVTLYWG